MRTLSLNSKRDDAPKKKKRVVEEEVPKKKKKRIVEVEDEAPKKKKLSKSTELALSTISRLDADGKNSIVGADAEKIQQLLESGHADSASSLLQKRLLQSLVDLIPHAENNVRATKGQKGVYQINSLITSVREILSDLQATKDRGAIAAGLVEKVIRPAFLDIGMALVQEEQRFATTVRDTLDPETYKQVRAANKELIARVAHEMNRKYEEAKNGAIQYLQS